MILNAGNLSMAMVFAVVSVWGMNLSDKHTGSYPLFVVVSFKSLVVTSIETEHTVTGHC